MLRALVRKRPIDLINSRTRSSPRSSIACGVSANANRAGVALLTPASVACAESTTATSRVKAFDATSSPFGSGSAAWKRSKIAVAVARETGSTVLATVAGGPHQRLGRRRCDLRQRFTFVSHWRNTR